MSAYLNLEYRMDKRLNRMLLSQSQHINTLETISTVFPSIVVACMLWNFITKQNNSTSKMIVGDGTWKIWVSLLVKFSVVLSCHRNCECQVYHNRSIVLRTLKPGGWNHCFCSDWRAHNALSMQPLLFGSIKKLLTPCRSPFCSRSHNTLKVLLDCMNMRWKCRKISLVRSHSKRNQCELKTAFSPVVLYRL